MPLSNESLRSVFRQLPTVVCVLTGSDQKAIYSATISSLVSIDIDAVQPVVCFVLKKTSVLGSILRANSSFTISVLDAEQVEASQKFALPRGKLAIQEYASEYFKEGSNSYGIPNSFALFSARLITTIEDYDSDIYIVAVENSKVDLTRNPLLYMNRNYGEFKSIKH